MKFENDKTFNFDGAFRGMRNPLNSWAKSDSLFGYDSIERTIDRCADIIDIWVEQELNKREIQSGPGESAYEELWKRYMDWLWKQGNIGGDNSIQEFAFIGPSDLNLAQRLIKSGPEHCKFLRQIFITVDITAPLYWWKEFDTYKIGTTANSTSTMHTLASKPITIDCFEIGDYDPELILESETNDIDDDNWIPHLKIKFFSDTLIKQLEQLRLAYLKTKDMRYWKELVRWLPEGWLQTRTVTMSYANLRNIYFQRKDHKLSEWREFCDWVLTLPYSKELITIE